MTKSQRTQHVLGSDKHYLPSIPPRHYLLQSQTKTKSCWEFLSRRQNVTGSMEFTAAGSKVSQPGCSKGGNMFRFWERTFTSGISTESSVSVGRTIATKSFHHQVIWVPAACCCWQILWTQWHLSKLLQKKWWGRVFFLKIRFCYIN